MVMPGKVDRELAAIDDLHGVVLAKLRGFHFSGGRAVDPQSIRQVLQQYADAVIEFINQDRR